MKTLGFDQPLYILPFDHRGSFQTTMFGWKGTLTSEQTAAIAATKQMIYEGFKAAVAAGVPKEKAGILVDEQFGTAILRDAAAHGHLTSCPAEKSGQEEFDFEYGEDFAEHIEAFQPTFCKVLVRYNPEGDPALNQRQATRLARLSRYLHDKSSSRFMFELLVPPEQPQLERLDGDTKAYDLELRPKLMVQAILGRGEDDKKVRAWLTTAAGVPGFIGFAVGRTNFWEPLVAWRDRKSTREDAVAAIARRYRQFVDIFERTQAA